MITGNISHIGKTKNYFSDSLNKALEYIAKTDFSKLPNGNHLIRENLISVNIFDYFTREKSELPAEVHKKNIDLHFLIEGEEMVGVSEESPENIPLMDYSEDKDAKLYKEVYNEKYFLLKKNDYALVFPGEVHRPGIINNGSRFVRKAVVKISTEMTDKFKKEGLDEREMEEKEKIVVIIPARGGSKGIPRKNLKEINGKPLLAYPIEAALNVPEIDRVIVSTEDEEIADVAKKYGAEVPFKRPEELSGDKVLTVPVLQHTVDWLKENENYDADIVVLLYATSPMLTSEKIREGIEKINGKKEVDSVVSLCLDDKYHWKEENGKLIRFYPMEIMPRQMMTPLLRENGALYIVRKELMKETGKYIGGNIKYILMKEKETWDIDTEDDFKIIEELMKKN